MTARKFVLRPYAARMAYQEKQRARYLRKTAAPLCRTCYGLERCQPCAKCKPVKP